VLKDTGCRGSDAFTALPHALLPHSAAFLRAKRTPRAGSAAVGFLAYLCAAYLKKGLATPPSAPHYWFLIRYSPPRHRAPYAPLPPSQTRAACRTSRNWAAHADEYLMLDGFSMVAATFPDAPRTGTVWFPSLPFTVGFVAVVTRIHAHTLPSPLTGAWVLLLPTHYILPIWDLLHAQLHLHLLHPTPSTVPHHTPPATFHTGLYACRTLLLVFIYSWTCGFFFTLA